MCPRCIELVGLHLGIWLVVPVLYGFIGLLSHRLEHYNHAERVEVSCVLDFENYEGNLQYSQA